MHRTPLAGLAIAALTLAVAGCGADEDPLASGGGETGGSTSSAGTITVGSANFPESQLLAEIYAQSLEADGVDVERRLNIGARELYLQALEDGSIDLLPEYNGALLSALVEGGEVPREVNTPDEVYDALQDVLPEGTEVLEQSEAEDKDTLTVTQETAEQYDLDSIDDLEGVAGDLTLGAGPEFQERYQGVVGLEDVYGVEFGTFRPLDSGGPLSVQALTDGTVDVANIFSTDSAIEQNDLVVLDDPENLFLAENIVPLIRSSVATDEVTQTLNDVSDALTTENLTEYLARVQVDKQPVASVAGAFVDEYNLG